MYDDRLSLAENITNVACEALEEENREIYGIIFKNDQAYKGCHKGILHFNNERFYQYLIAKNIAKHLGGFVKTEHEYHDVVLVNHDANLSAVIEIKRWMSATGEPELPKIANDVTKLRSSKVQGEKILLVISSNPTGSTNENSRILLEKTAISQCKKSIKAFPAINGNNEIIDIWVMCIRVDE